MSGLFLNKIKIWSVLCKDWQRYFSKETFLLYPSLINFTQRKKKTYDTNDDLSMLSLVSIIVFIYSLGKKFYCTNLKRTEQEMILPCIKSFNEKIREKKQTNMQAIFQHFRSMTWKQRTQICFVGIRILNNSQNTTNIYTAGLKAGNFIKKDSNTRVFCVISEPFKNTC